MHNREKEKPTKVLEVEQSEEHAPRMFSFSKKSHKRIIEATHHSNDIKEKEKSNAKGDDNKQKKLRDDDRITPMQIRLVRKFE